jgi:hypothetical protein
VLRFFPSSTNGWPFVCYELVPAKRRRFRRRFFRKSDGSLPPLFALGNHAAPALSSDDLAELLDERAKALGAPAAARS